jgi:type VI secretion system secreted protein VgrG
MPALPTLPLWDQTQDLFFEFMSDGAPDVSFVVTDFAIEEQLSRLPSAQISLASRTKGVDLTRLMDKPGRLTIHDRYAPPRHFHGIVVQAERGDAGMRAAPYAVTLMPTLHRLRFGSDCRIFQQKSAPEIIETILKENGVETFVWRLSETHEVREYCVQYRETHFDFVERLLAEEGVCYFFEHERDRHRLILTDATIAAEAALEDGILEHNATPGGDVKGHFVSSFSWRETTAPSDLVQRDHFFKNPAHSYEATERATEVNGLTRKLEIYHYPGRYKSDSVGAAFTRRRLESYRDEASHGLGSGRFQGLSAGRRFQLVSPDEPALSRPYLLVATSFEGVQSGGMEEDAGEGEGEGTFLRCSFRCIRHDTPWRPAPCPKPLVEGPQMAIVTGPPGEEIYCDKFGRVKVQFPWDRYGQNDDKSSCWIRVSQNWAGGTWGHIAIPRIRQHVVVDFLEGDPDQPIITGRAYNARETVPYDLPDHKTRMVLRSNSHKSTGFNELTFEDRTGEENLFVNASKDKTVRVRNNHTERVDANQVSSVGSNQAIEVGGHQKTEVAGSMNVTVGGAGAGALALMGPLMGLAGQTSSLLQQAGAAAGGGGPALGAMAMGLASSALGFLNGGGLGARGGVIAGSEPRADAGVALSQAGSGVGEAAGGMFSMPGVMNTVVGSFKTDSVGIAKVEQIGLSKISNVGQTDFQKVGKKKRIQIGEELEILVGGGPDKDGNEQPPKSILIMKSNGDILLKGVKVYIHGESHVQHISAMIDNN